jgi:hypothetical protein
VRVGEDKEGRRQAGRQAEVGVECARVVESHQHVCVHDTLILMAPTLTHILAPLPMMVNMLPSPFP